MSIPLRELEFALFDVPKLDESRTFGGTLLDPDLRETAREVLRTAEKIALTTLAPCAARLDVDEPFIRDGRVVLPDETGHALQQLAEGGFTAMAFAEQDGGLGLPFSLSQACAALFASANVSIYSYALLTQGAANLIVHFGSPSQRKRWVPPMLAGRVYGTMCLSEPHAGSSLADITTLATPREDGRYNLRGRKMWISGGEHELGENIVHLVLARTPDAPPGVKGISLFLVPRFRDSDRNQGNGVSLVGLNHKMGWRGHVNTALAFGDEGECVGELMGSLHHGLSYMFLMMNEARITVGLCASAIGFAGYQYALGYAHERRQGRKLGERNPAAPQIPIIEHADVKRMLLSQKAWVEGSLDLVLYCARLVDLMRTSTHEQEKQRTALLLDLLTPIAKSWPAEYALEANKLAIQVAGGAGYTRDLPLERLYRDNRLNPIHEGALGIHGLDLLGRKVSMQEGAALRAWSDEIDHTIFDARNFDFLQPMCKDLLAAKQQLLAVTERLSELQRSGKVERALANATPYLDAFGGITVAWRWLARALIAAHTLKNKTVSDATTKETAFMRGKLKACEHFRLHDLPRHLANLTLVASLDTTALDMSPTEY
jgi:alkylation response protein AidB-like acyl-CoA dehydrogenase